MTAIISEAGRYIVTDERRVYGVYRSLEMATRRSRQVEGSRGPKPGARAKRPEHRK